MPANAAMEAAQALAATPSLVHAMRREPLPEGIPLLLNMLAEEPDAATDVSDAFGTRDLQHLRAVAEAYVQRVMLFSSADPYRVMGVPPHASRAEIRANLRLLMTWLHPDKNASEWRSAFASRVLAAWKTLASVENNAHPSEEPGLAPAPVAPAQPPIADRPFATTPPWVRKVPVARTRPDRLERQSGKRRGGMLSLWPQTRARRIALLLVLFVLIVPSAYLFASEYVQTVKLRDADVRR